MSPRSPHVNARLREASRERIVTAAIDVLAGKGFHQATVSDITEQAGVSRGLISYYFPTKHALADELLDRYLEGIHQLLDVEGTPDERLSTIIDRALLAAHRTRHIQQMTLGLMIDPGTHPLYAAAEARKDRLLSELEERLRELFHSRGAEDPHLEGIMLRSLLEGVTVKLVIYADQYPLEPIRRRIHAMYQLPCPTTDLIEDRPRPAGPMRATGATPEPTGPSQ
ncbi:TetR/AcrR family transcriptional regulator [Kitasatospora sp. NPDC006786]|uniref:TetR/AcrR family transcriptional regulator n=1 Tax=unclassified Kitasatospora TaxID=2633591 RepID=UPI0033FF63A9